MIEFLQKNHQDILTGISIIASAVLWFSLYRWFKSLERWHLHLVEWNEFMMKHAKIPENNFKEVSAFLGGMNDTGKASHNGGQGDS